MEQTVLLTGATGFLGSHILKRLLFENYNVIVLERTFSNTFRIQEDNNCVKTYDIDSIKIESIFQENKIDLIIHTATQYGRKEESIIDIVKSNLMLPLELIVLAEKYSVEKFINTDTLLDKRVSSYALSKKQFRNWLQFYSTNMICINVSLEHFFGPLDDSTKFVTYILKNLMNNIESIDLTLGEQERDFIYIDDVVEAFMTILKCSEYSNGFYEYEIGSGKNVKIKDFILLAKQIIGNRTTQLNFGAFPYRENEVMRSDVNLANISALGWKPLVDFKDGLKQTIKSEKGLI